METWMVITGAAAVIAAVLLIAALVMRARHRSGAQQTTQLKAGFGPEYTKAVEEQGRSGAEEDLIKRQKRADLFNVQALSPGQVASYRERWTATQAQFLDEPEAALTAADHLVGEVIAARGYPTVDFEQGASAVSVDHPRAVQEYRAAHEIVLSNQRNPATADELRSAFVQYRGVLTELLDDNVVAAPLAAGVA